jgi:broad specificity phosphatase PhoE
LKLILIRHGETLWNREKRVQGISDIELSDRGIQQVEHLARSLKDEKIETIISSPLKRAYRTASAINQFHNVTIESERDLQELDQGDLEGMRFSELMKDHLLFLEKWLTDPASVVMPNGESLVELQKRAWGAIERIIQRSQDTLVVSHNFTIMSILCKFKNLELSRFREVHVDTASATVVMIENGAGQVTSLNNTEHLRKL